MSQIRLSFVIPCYNSFSLMEDTLSFFENNYRDDVEVILVDDHSTDNTMERLKEYSTKAKAHIRVMQTTFNAGPGVARNVGMEAAVGDYITFLDADDHYVDETFNLIFPLLDGCWDLVICDYWMVRTNGIKEKGSSFFCHMQQGEILPELTVAYLRGSTWCKFYKRSVIEQTGIRFLPKKRCEDMPFTIGVAGHCKKIYYVKEALYCYMQVETSIMHQKQFASIENTINSFQCLEQMLKDVYPTELEAYYTVVCLSTAAQKDVLVKTPKQWCEGIKRLEEIYPKCYQNPYISRYSILRKYILFLIRYRCYWLLKLYVCLKSIIRGGRH